MDVGMRDENGGAIRMDRVGGEAVTEERPLPLAERPQDTEFVS